MNDNHSELAAFASLLQLRFGDVDKAYGDAVQEMSPQFLFELYPYDGVEIAHRMRQQASRWLTEPATFDRGGEAKLTRFLANMGNFFDHTGFYKLPTTSNPSGNFQNDLRPSLKDIGDEVTTFTKWTWRTKGNRDFYLVGQLIEKIQASHLMFHDGLNAQLTVDFDGVEPREQALFDQDLHNLDVSLRELFTVNHF